MVCGPPALQPPPQGLGAPQGPPPLYAALPCTPILCVPCTPWASLHGTHVGTPWGGSPHLLLLPMGTPTPLCTLSWVPMNTL